jgi:peptidase E
LTESDGYRTCTVAFVKKNCQIKCHNLVYSSIQEDLGSLLYWADVVICDWNDDVNYHELLRDSIFSQGSSGSFVLCAKAAAMNAILEEETIENLTKWRYCPEDTAIANSSEAAAILANSEKLKRVIGIDNLAAHIITGDESMAISGDKSDICHIFFRDETTNEITSTPLPTSWEEPIPTEELVEFHEPATNPHLETLAEHVNTDFVIADDVIPEVSHHRRVNSQSLHQKTLSEISIEDVFPKIVAAGKPAALQLGPIFDKVLELSGKELPNLLFIGTASFDRTDRFNSNTKRFREIGCDVRRLDVSDEESVPSIEEMRQLVVDWADVIMCAGGNTLHALIRWKEVGLDLLIKEASMKGAVLCGGSAGAGCWFSSLHTDSLRPDNTKNKEHVLDDMDDEDLADWDYTKISALGFVDAMCVPHYDVTGTNGNARSEDAERMLEENPTTPAIGIDELAALVVVGDEAFAVSGDGKATCHVVVPDQKTGEVISAPLPTSWQEPVPLEEVLEFPIPATGEHLDALEKYVNTDFVIADDVISEVGSKTEQNNAFPKIVAAGIPSALQLGPIFDKVLELSGKELPNLLFIGTASFDRTDRFNSNTKRFREIGCDVRRLDVSDEESVPSIEEMRQLVVDWADVIMCAGGNTLHALIRWKEVGLDLLIKEASMKGIVLCGGSAGAGCWFTSLHTDSLRPDNTKNKEHVLDDMDDEELRDWDYARISGLGFIDAMCVPHFDATGTNGQARSDDAEKFLREDPSAPAIGIDGLAALVVVGNQVRSVSGDGKATCRIFVLRTVTDECVSGPLPSTLEGIKSFHSKHYGFDTTTSKI